jgi:anti-sigma factor RsiW
VADPRPRLSAADEADLAALADGRIDPARRAAVQARIDADPVLAAAFADQRAAVRALAVVSEQVSAPLALRARVEELQRAAAQPARASPGRAAVLPSGRRTTKRQDATRTSLAVAVRRPR